MKFPLPSAPPARTQVVAPVDTAGNSAIFGQDAFLRLLGIERKRTERSKRPFVLMLLQADGLLKAGLDDQALDKVLRALAEATRETDVTGWYRTGQTIGVILTEINGLPVDTIERVLRGRVRTALENILAIDEIEQVRLSFHIYPENHGKNGSNGDKLHDPVIYPDVWSAKDAKKASRLIKRSIDIAGSLGALIVSSPVLLAVAAAIKLTSKGPVLFRQDRVGQNGRRFTFLKFRSMYVNNDDAVHKEYVQSLIAGAHDRQTNGKGPGVFKLTRDIRITPIGAFLRKTSLDEFPQFLNVLTGEMSLVGPRPAIPYEVDRYDLWHRQRILAVKPGITGPWQVMGRSRIPFADMVRLDLQYARTWTPWVDIKILLKTPGAVIFGNGAF